MLSEKAVYPPAFWVASTLVDLKADPRFKEGVTPEEVTRYCAKYYTSLTAVNMGYLLLTRDWLGTLFAQLGFVLGVEDWLYFLFKGEGYPDLGYLPSYMNTPEKLRRNSLVVGATYLISKLIGI